MEELVDTLWMRVREEGAVRTKALLEGHDDARAELLEALAQRGLERGEKHVRVPLAAQLRELVATDGEVAEKGLRKRLAGAESADEVSHAVDHALREGALVRAIGEAGAVVLVQAADVVDEACTARLHSGVNEAQRRLKAAQRRALPVRRTLLALLEPSGDEALEARLLSAIRDRRGPLVAVAEVVDAVVSADDGTALSAVHGALRSLAAAGQIELRPESGVGSLSDDEARLCPRTPDGVCLSYLRPLR